MAGAGDDDVDEEDGARVKNHYAPLPGAPNVEVRTQHPGRLTLLVLEIRFAKSQSTENFLSLNQPKKCTRVALF